ncbi:MAG: spiro-SPASM protein [Spirochaetaceae bacterium]|nr:spiro-SPASM protein [Spirochaetaceae bacterium]
MNVLAVLYGAGLAKEAFEPVFSGKSAFSLAFEKARDFPGVSKILFFGKDGEAYPELPGQTESILLPLWTKKALLEKLAAAAAGFDLVFFAWADCPFLDPGLAESMAARHRRYAAEYSYADGWPYGFAPEILAPHLPALLSGLVSGDDGPVERDTLFNIIQKDINAFDIETEISPVDLRAYRLSLAADSKRNLLLLERLKGAGLAGIRDAEKIIEGHPGLLRTLPAFFPVQVAGPCPQSCQFCPYPGGLFGGTQDRRPVQDRKEFMDTGLFVSLLDKIIAFAGDGVIDLSLWGELSLHPQREALINAVLERPALSLIVETSGLSWGGESLEALAVAAASAPARKNREAALSWIVSLDAFAPERYRVLRGGGEAEASECAEKLAGLFPGAVYVQAVRVREAEDDIEQFYRHWKEKKLNVIIQKYDYFSGEMPDLRAADLSPLNRFPCWHIMRDFPVLMDGTVPACGEDLRGSRVLGNVFGDRLEKLWENGEALYREHTEKNYGGICALCDEYYTYNF